MRRETTYQKLATVADIKDYDQRKAALRELATADNVVAIVVQRCYHPNYNWSLPKGPMPEPIFKKSGHSEPGPFLQSIKKWNVYRIPEEDPFNSNIKKGVIEMQFMTLYEAVASDDADLLVAVKDKQLPWETLNLDFVVDALPELFPPSFRKEDTEKANDPVITTKTKGSKKDQCVEIMQNNPGLSRKDYLELFITQLEMKKSTASMYYQELKDKV